MKLAPLVRALLDATVFTAVVLVFLPTRVLGWAGVGRPATIGAAGGVGLALVALGGGLALWCVLAFALVGRGTPAPFDPPRRLVVSGPYRFVRNPMYVGALVALAGASLFFRSAALLGFTVIFGLVAHAFVRVYEERALARLFGDEYDDYRRRVRRWIPTLRPLSGPLSGPPR